MTMTMEQAVELLELFESTNYSEKAIKKAARKAKGKWHPDRVATAGEQKIAEYEAKFKLIAKAEEWILECLFGAKSKTEISSEEKHEQMKEHAETWHSNLKGRWDEIKNKKEKYAEEEEVVFEGWTVPEFINDMRGNRFFDSVNAVAMIIISFVLVMLIGMFSNGPLNFYRMGIVDNPLGLLLNVFLTLTVESFFFMLISLVFGFGIVQYFLPDFIKTPYLYIAEKLNYILRSKRSLFRPIMALYTSTIAGFVESLIGILAFVVSKILWVLSLAIKDKRIGEVTVTHQWYANISEAIIDDILQKEIEDLEYKDLVYLKHLSEEYQLS